MWVFFVIGIEFVASIALIVCWIKYDARIKAWEDRQILKAKKAARRQLLRFCVFLDRAEQRYNRIGRKIRREICAQMLARDGLTVAPMTVEDEITVTADQDAVYAEVLRLLGE